MNSFRFSLNQEKSFPRRIGSVPRQEQCFPWASGPQETLFCLGTLPLYLGMKFLGLMKTHNKFMGPPAFFLFIISVLHMGNLDDMKIVCDVRRVLDADIVWDTEIVI